MKRLTKIPKFVYFTLGDNGWVNGPYINPKKGYINRKFKLTEKLEKSLKKIGVISFSIKDFLVFKTNFVVEHCDKNNSFISNDVEYRAICGLNGVCGHTFDGVIETIKPKRVRIIMILKLLH